MGEIRGDGCNQLTRVISVIRFAIEKERCNQLTLGNAELRYRMGNSAFS